ncbi:MAG TPA: hypothetical protein VF743_12585 [Acidimicrobiales bacterium]
MVHRRNARGIGRGARGLAVGLVAAAAVGAVAGCVQPVGPARTAEDYELKAADTAETVVSAVRTAEIGADVAHRDRAFPPYVAVVLGEAESDAAAALDTFESVQPPGPSSDHLRAELADLVDPAVDALADLRIAARRSDGDALAAAARGLEDLARPLEAFAEEHG